MPYINEQLHILAEFDPDVSQKIAPDPRADKREYAKGNEVCLQDTRRKRDEGANDRQQSTNEEGDVPVPIDPMLGKFQVPLFQQQPAPVPLQEAPPTIKSQQIRRHRADQTAN